MNELVFVLILVFVLVLILVLMVYWYIGILVLVLVPEGRGRGGRLQGHPFFSPLVLFVFGSFKKRVLGKPPPLVRQTSPVHEELGLRIVRRHWCVRQMKHGSRQRGPKSGQRSILLFVA